MHPRLWTIPGIEFDVPSYGFLMAIAIVVALIISVRRARRLGADPATITTLGIIGVALGYIGCRGMYVLHHHFDQVKSGAMGVGGAAALTGGGEILGGVVLAVAGCAAYLLIRRKSVGMYLDLTIPSLLLAMGIGRIGCYFFGCCHGGICETSDGDRQYAWLVRFPYGSPAYVQQWEDGALDAPPGLVWTPARIFSSEAGDSQPRLVPATLLNRDGVADSDALFEWIDLALERTELRRSNPDDPLISPLEKRMASLWPEISGKNKSIKTENVALAMHLREIAEEDSSTPEAALAPLRRLATTEHSRWVHPTQLYDAIALVLLFALLSAIFFRQRRFGWTSAWAMVLYPVNRILQEIIRSDNPHDVFGLTISQFISLLVLLFGVTMLIVLRLRTPAMGTIAPATVAPQSA